MKIDYMKEYIAVVDNLNFTITAQHLHMTQPALSRHIASIEESMGVRLLYRNTHNVEVTLEGKMVYDDFNRIINIYESTKDKVLRQAGNSAGFLKIGIPYYCMEYMYRIVAAFKKKFPHITLEILSFQPSPEYRALKKAEIDIAILFRHVYPDSEEIRFHNFAKEPLVVMIPCTHLYADKEEILLEDLENMNVVFSRNNYFSDAMEELLRLNKVYPKEIFYTDSIDTLPYTLCEHNALALEPDCVKNMIKPNVVCIPLNAECSSIPLAVAYHIDNTNLAIPIFTKVVDDEFGNHG